MLKPFGLSIFFYRTKTILSTKNIRRYIHEYATSISQNTHICCAKYSHSNTKYIATNLQQHNIQKTKTILLHAKNHTFARQKGGFYTPKTPFLFFVSITNTLLMCYEYSVKWLRTPTKCPRKHTKHPTNTHEMSNEQSVKCPRNTPPGVGADSSRPYPYTIKNVYFHNQICVSVPHFVGTFIYAGTINRPLQLLTVCHFAANGLPIMLRNIPQQRNVHTAILG